MNNNQWITKCQHWKNLWPIFEDKEYQDKTGIDLYYFIEQINKHSIDGDVFVSDAGSAYYTTYQNLKIKNCQIIASAGAQGDMGYAVPASIGAQLADSSRRVIAITGDGSFNTNIQELATITNLQLPIKIFILNNGGYLSIKNTQTKFYGGRVYGTAVGKGLWFPDVEKVAQAYDIPYCLLKQNKDLDNLDCLLNVNTAMLFEVQCNPEQQIIPTLSPKIDPVTGKKIQTGLDDMYPFVDKSILLKEALFKL